MKTLFAALAVLTLAFGTVSLATPANASTTYLNPPNQYEGANN
jgi:hypothetical protein